MTTYDEFSYMCEIIRNVWKAKEKLAMERINDDRIAFILKCGGKVDEREIIRNEHAITVAETEVREREKALYMFDTFTRRVDARQVEAIYKSVVRHFGKERRFYTYCFYRWYPSTR